MNFFFKKTILLIESATNYRERESRVDCLVFEFGLPCFMVVLMEGGGGELRTEFLI